MLGLSWPKGLGHAHPGKSILPSVLATEITIHFGLTGNVKAFVQSFPLPYSAGENMLARLMCRGGSRYPWNVQRDLISQHD